jgi:hypothetical protein
LVRPVTVQESAPVVVHDLCVNVVEVTVYEVMTAPSVAGAVHETVTFDIPATTVGRLGFDGTLDGTTATDSVDVGPVPSALWAFTVKRYVAPLVRPVTVQVRAPVVVHE